MWLWDDMRLFDLVSSNILSYLQLVQVRFTQCEENCELQKFIREQK